MCAVRSIDPQRADTVAHYHAAIERVILTMQQNFDQELTLQDMASVAHMSPYHLNRVFSHTTGVPPGRFLTALRLQAAKRLLVTTEHSVTDICIEVGYNSLGTFTRRFGELVGLPPSRLRELADAGPRSHLPSLQHCLKLSREARSGLQGRITAPESFDGVIFVGLFSTAVPQGRPMACALLAGPGPFQLTPTEDGDYFLVSAGLAWSLDPRDLLLYERVLRAGSVGAAVKVRQGVFEETPELTLRPPERFDPPILLTFPVIMAERAAGLAGYGPTSSAESSSSFEPMAVNQ